jgi:uncharacterized protein (DUF1697 family)
MTRYVCLLRGVNVNGVTVKSAELKAAISGLGYAEVRTVLASGNVVFTSADASAPVKTSVEAQLRAVFGYDAWVVLLTAEQLTAIVADFPFEADRDNWHPYVLSGSDEAVLDELMAAGADLDPAVESIRRGNGVIYWHVDRAVGIDSPFAKITAKTRYRATTTTRNLRTLVKVLAVV